MNFFFFFFFLGGGFNEKGEVYVRMPSWDQLSGWRRGEGGTNVLSGEWMYFETYVKLICGS